MKNCFIKVIYYARHIFPSARRELERVNFSFSLFLACGMTCLQFSQSLEKNRACKIKFFSSEGVFLTYFVSFSFNNISKTVKAILKQN